MTYRRINPAPVNNLGNKSEDALLDIIRNNRPGSPQSSAAVSELNRRLDALTEQLTSSAPNRPAELKRRIHQALKHSRRKSKRRSTRGPLLGSERSTGQL